MQPELRTAVQHGARVPRVDVLAGVGKFRRFSVPVRAEAGPDVRAHARQPPEPKAIAAGDLERCDRRRQRNAHSEGPAAAQEGESYVLLVTRRAEPAEETIA